MNQNREITRMILTDTLHNEPEALIGLLDYLIIEKNYDLKRLLRIAEKYFHMPEPLAVATLNSLY